MYIQFFKIWSLKYIMILPITCIVFSASSQSDNIGLEKKFYKSKQILEQDEYSLKYYKKSKRQKIAATSFGFVSIAAIASGVYFIIQSEPTGQSADVAIYVVGLGLGLIASLTGLTGLAYNSKAKKNKRKSIDFYHERFGYGIILNQSKQYNTIIRANIGNNGIGLVFSF
jgi:hypothetical protein